MSGQQSSNLKKTLTSVHLWAIAVGLVISGEYFGWNYGWAEAGTIGFLITTLFVTVLYITFIFSFTELTTAIPQAGGPFAYALKAFGNYGGLIAGYATMVEFLFATPAIAFALGSYAHFLYPFLPVLPVGIGCFIAFTLLNVLGIKESASFSLFITILATGELLVYFGIIAPHFSFQNFVADALPVKFEGVVRALPFAIWFYLAIEGVAMVAEEVKDPKRTIAKGYVFGILTLLVLAFGVMILTGGIGNWKALSNMDYPLPEAIGFVLGKDNGLTKLFASIGLFGLIASFHGIILGYSRQIFALSRAGFLPDMLSKVNTRFQTPHAALIAGGIIGIAALCSGTTDKLIILSVMGALLMYSISMLSLFKLRKSDPGLDRPVKALLYPVFPVVALVLSTVSLGAMIYYNFLMSILFFGGLLVTILIFLLVKNKQTA